MSSKAAGNNFDVIRFAFASLVIFSHSYPMATGNESSEPLLLFSHGQMSFGALAVDCFFIISGYLIAQSWIRKPRVADYLSKRVRRIYPGFLVASTLCALVIAPLFPVAQAGPIVTPAFTLDFFLHALRLIYLQPVDAFPNNPAPGSVNGSLWSIPFEAWCYVGLMVVGLSGRLARARWLACALALLVAASFVVAFLDLKIGGKVLGVIFGYPTFWARLLPFFVAGMTFHAFGDRIAFTRRGALVAAAAILAACQVPYGLLFVLPVAATYLILWLAFVPTRHLRHFARHGDYSYGIYLYAFPIGQLLAHWTGLGSPILLFLVAWPLSVAAGACSWHFIERPFMKPASAQRVLARVP